MISHIRGKIFEKNEGFCVIEVNDIGYKIFMPQRTLDSLSREKIQFIHIFHRIKDDQNDLYGFALKEEKMFFEKLTSVSGIGPKTALSILEFPLSQIKTAIEEENINFLSQAKGMGKKTISRLILELKGNLPEIREIKEKNKLSHNLIEISCTLENLGFQRKDIQEIFQKNTKSLSHLSDEEIIKWALQELS